MAAFIRHGALARLKPLVLGEMSVRSALLVYTLHRASVTDADTNSILAANVPLPNVKNFSNEEITSAMRVFDERKVRHLEKWAPWSYVVELSARGKALKLTIRDKKGTTTKFKAQLDRSEVGLVLCGGQHVDFSTYASSAITTLFRGSARDLRESLTHSALESVGGAFPYREPLGLRFDFAVKPRQPYVTVADESRVTNVRIDHEGITYWTAEASKFVASKGVQRALMLLADELRDPLPAGLTMLNSVAASLHF